MSMTHCADCGRVIFLTRPSTTGSGRWAHQLGRARIFTCRATFDAGRLVAADYHHPASEPQRHYPAA